MYHRKQGRGPIFHSGLLCLRHPSAPDGLGYALSPAHLSRNDCSLLSIVIATIKVTVKQMWIPSESKGEFGTRCGTLVINNATIK